jgi:hypothetical protein
MQSALLRKQGEDNPHIRWQVIQTYIASRRTIPASNLLWSMYRAPTPLAVEESRLARAGRDFLFLCSVFPKDSSLLERQYQPPSPNS